MHTWTFFGVEQHRLFVMLWKLFNIYIVCGVWIVWYMWWQMHETKKDSSEKVFHLKFIYSTMRWKPQTLNLFFLKPKPWGILLSPTLVGFWIIGILIWFWTIIALSAILYCFYIMVLKPTPPTPPTPIIIYPISSPYLYCLYFITCLLEPAHYNLPDIGPISYTVYTSNVEGAWKFCLFIWFWTMLPFKQ